MKVIRLLQDAAIIDVAASMPDITNPQRHRYSADTKAGRKLIASSLSGSNLKLSEKGEELKAWNDAIEAKRLERKNKLSQRGK